MRIGMDIKKIHFYLLKHFLRNILLRYLLLAVYLFLVTKGVMSYSSEKVIRISSCLGTEIFTILKYDKLVYVAMGLIVICAILLDHNYKKTTDEIKKLNK